MKRRRGFYVGLATSAAVAVASDLDDVGLLMRRIFVEHARRPNIKRVAACVMWNWMRPLW